MFNSDFYPTKDTTIEKLIEGIDLRMINNLLEPSAGKGNIVEYIIEKAKNVRSYSKVNIDIDCIELDKNLTYILQGKGFRVVHDDFLTYNTLKSYSHIIANFPFSEGDKHLKKALDMLEMSGGCLRCIVNAETIRNPYSNLRKEILFILNSYNATIDFLEDEFIDAERTTAVEIAIIKCDVLKKEVGSILLEELKQAQIEEERNTYESNYIVTNDFIKAIITQYNFECKAGLKLIEEYNKLSSFTSSEFTKEDNILTLRISNDRGYSQPSENILKNDYLKKVRYKYWKALFSNKEFTKLFTSNLQRDFYNRLEDLSNYDFTEYNINEIKRQLNLQVATGVKETILKLFDDFSCKHSLGDGSGNIHYFNGWKTNSSWKMNKKVIIRLNGFGSWASEFDPLWYQCIDKLSDIEKVFNYLDTQKAEELTLRDILKEAKENHQTKGIITKFFKVDFYVKGSCHLTFLDLELLKKFNIFAAQNKNWLPPEYSKKEYKDMTQEEKEVVDSFEGESEYKKTMSNSEYYLYNPSKTLMLN